MAIVKTGDMYGQVGRLGQNVYYTAYSETRSRKLAASVTNPRTQAQMLQRVRWANLVNFYRVNRNWMKYAFETKKKNQSEYNKFMSLNVATSPIYLTKQQAGAGACVVYPYMITQGSLPTIEQNLTSGKIVTNLFLPADFELDESVSVSALSNALMSVNPALRYGDQISFIRLYQQANPTAAVPYMVLRKYELVLSSTDTSKVELYWPMDIIASETIGGTNCVIVTAEGRSGGVSFILSRTIAGKTYVSTQRIVTAGNADVIEAYSSPSQLQAAIDSYGESSEAFLTSTYARETSEVGVQLSILTLETSWGRTAAGGYAEVPAVEVSLGDVTFGFNGPLGTATGIQGTLEIGGQIYTLSGGTAASNSVQFADVSIEASDHTQYIKRATVTVNSVTYEITFSEIIRNEDTIHGLE